MSKKSSVAVIGLGAMGLPIAINLAQAGYSTQAWNRSVAPRSTATSKGVEVLDALSGLSADIFLITLPDLPQLELVLEAGLSKALKPGNLLIIMSTVSPTKIVSFAQRMKEVGVEVLDCPMSGGELGAKNGSLSLMIGGTNEIFEWAKPILEVLGKTIVLMGPIGTGQLTKAVNQLVVSINLVAIGEAVTLARRAGLDTEKVLDIFSGGLANSAALELRRPKILSGNFEAGGKSKFLVKDLAFAMEAANSTHTELPISKIVAQLYSNLIASGDGDLDHSAIIKEIERLNN